MAQAASITINDRESTPVAHAFVPQKIETELATFAQLNGSPLKANVLSISRRSTESGLVKVRLRLAMPVVSTDTSTGVEINTLLRTAYADLQVTFAPDSTLQERKNLIGIFANGLAESQTVLDSTLTGLENVF
jgi:hypothetical protein